jgi:hypothetical protein
MMHAWFSRERWKVDVSAFVAACAAAVVFTWPLASRATDHLLAASYGWDAYTNTMLLGSRVDAAVARGPLSLFDEYYFAPLPRAIVFNENHFGLSLLFAPFYLLGQNPLLAYNLTLLLSLSLSVFFSYLLVRRLTGNGWAGFLAGVAFTFSPYVAFEFGRIQLLATQWIPACFYFLQQSFERRRVRDCLGFWLVFLLQLGSCLYYALFLLPLLASVALGSWVRKRPPRRTAFTFAALGAAAAALALALLRPYFSERDHFDLERSLDFASSYDGKLAFFAHVSETNLGLPWLHHADNPYGAHEEIAFPGFTLLALALFAFITHGVRAWQRHGSRAMTQLATRALTVLAIAVPVTLFFHSMLAGAVALGVVAWLWRRELLLGAATHGLGVYTAALCLAIVLFLGLEPCSWHGRPVHGLYYYLYTYFPGYSGMRKVSRQAVMTTFFGAVVASFGSSELLSRAKTKLAEAALFAGLLGATTLELRCFPYPLAEQWAGASVPAAYRFLARLPARDLLAVVPQNEGKERFRGDAGMALHNYLALYHKHRFLDGQSSFTPPVTDLVRRAQADLPSASAHDVLRALGTDHLLIHGADLPDERRQLSAELSAQPERYRSIFRDGADEVFTLLDTGTAPPRLAEIPPLPAAARRLAPSELVPWAALEPDRARYAADGDESTLWSSRTRQATGQAFELGLTAPARIVALEIENSGHEFFLPLSYVLESRLGDGPYRAIARQPELLLYRTQIYAPKQFVFRIVLPEPVEADRLRLVVDRPMPEVDIVIHEARVYVAPSL